MQQPDGNKTTIQIFNELLRVIQTFYPPTQAATQPTIPTPTIPTPTTPVQAPEEKQEAPEVNTRKLCRYFNLAKAHENDDNSGGCTTENCPYFHAVECRYCSNWTRNRHAICYECIYCHFCGQNTKKPFQPMCGECYYA